MQVPPAGAVIVHASIVQGLKARRPQPAGLVTPLAAVKSPSPLMTIGACGVLAAQAVVTPGPPAPTAVRRAVAMSTVASRFIASFLSDRRPSALRMPTSRACPGCGFTQRGPGPTSHVWSVRRFRADDGHRVGRQED